MAKAIVPAIVVFRAHSSNYRIQSCWDRADFRAQVGGCHWKVVTGVHASDDGVTSGRAWNATQSELMSFDADGFAGIGLQKTGSAQQSDASLGHVAGRNLEDTKLSRGI
jgi:hypothetical protein